MKFILIGLFVLISVLFFLSLHLIDKYVEKKYQRRLQALRTKTGLDIHNANIDRFHREVKASTSFAANSLKGKRIAWYLILSDVKIDKTFSFRTAYSEHKATKQVQVQLDTMPDDKKLSTYKKNDTYFVIGEVSSIDSDNATYSITNAKILSINDLKNN